MTVILCTYGFLADVQRITVMDPRWMKHQEMQDRVLPWGPFNVLLSIKGDLEYASESNRSFPVFEGFFELTHAVLFVNIGTPCRGCPRRAYLLATRLGESNLG